MMNNIIPFPKQKELIEDPDKEEIEAFEQALRNFKKRNGVSFFESLKGSEKTERIIARNMAKETFRIRTQLIYESQDEDLL